MTANHRLIAFDLPGNDQSRDAQDPQGTYTRCGLADTVVELLGKLGVPNVIVFGWSLGGHIGLDMIPRFPGLRGLMITAAPPVGHDKMAQAFKASPQMGQAGKQDWSPANVDSLDQGVIGKSAEPFMRDAVARADGRLRKTLFASLGANSGPNPRQVVESSPTACSRERRRRCHRQSRLLRYGQIRQPLAEALLPFGGLGHASFWEDPGELNPLLERFLSDVESGRASALVRDTDSPAFTGSLRESVEANGREVREV